MKNAVGIKICGQAFINDWPIFPPIAMDLLPGGWTCLLGLSGAGKTTILRLIAGIAEAVSFHGTIKCGDDLGLKGRVAYMAQTDLLMPWLNVMDNVVLGQRLRGHRIDLKKANELLGELELSAHRMKFPHMLSGGQRQRVALARTLMEECPIVLLDEPFSALDARLRSDMQDLFAHYLSGATVLLVTHDPGEAARLGERIYLLNETGIESLFPPPGKAVREVDDHDMLAWQGRLLSQLRDDRNNQKNR